ncbi:MAG TPA: RluA family pseudouridine synthase, partial [Ktedonobacteraceae bacterium]|nr:RluA family pseudouridine synthase [Ktedonobacteraceae bacterium]
CMTQKTIPVIYQDHYMLVVNKPAGLVIHPTYKHTSGTMWDAILEYLDKQGKDDWQPPELPDKPEWSDAPEQVRFMLREQRLEKMRKEEGLLPKPCLLHRLDKDTSGVVALARTEYSRRHLVRQFQEHRIVKRYLTVVKRGAPDWARPRSPFKIMKKQDEIQAMQFDSFTDIVLDEENEFVLDGALQRDPSDRRRCIVGPDGREAQTVIKVIATEGEFILLEARPVTGRTHQIRAHLAALGYAIVGDTTYSLPVELSAPVAAMKRQFLHAYCLEFRSYPDNQLRTFVAPLADDLTEWLEDYLPVGLEVMYASKTIPA